MGVTEFLTAVPIVPARDVTAATAWYRDVLGFDVFLEEEDYGIVGSGEAWIHFYGPRDEDLS
jgi:catechol 2,3-dioxygenase-like lactoylglutathione lyase family enzyme